MKKINLIYILALILSVSMLSCKNEGVKPKPQTPVDETNDLGHDMWTKVKFEFRMGHTHGRDFHGDPDSDKIKYFKRYQSVEFYYDEKGNLVRPSEPLRFIEGKYYAMEITYYNKKGEVMNEQFTSEEMAKIHQHFFLNKNAKKIDTDVDFEEPNKILNFFYRDTDPAIKNIKEDGVTLRKDPIGLKGYFYINKSHVDFDLNVILVHIINGTKYKEDGTFYPFYEPSRAFLGTQDLNLKIPARVYAKMPHLESEEQQFFEDISKEFGITVDEAKADYDKAVDLESESSTYWM